MYIKLKGCSSWSIPAISEERGLVVISQDVKALYPSIDKTETVRIVGRMIEETELEFDNIDFKCLGKYLAVHLTQEKITNNHLISVIPARKKEVENNGNVSGRKPGIAYLDSDLDRNKEENGIGGGRERIQHSCKRKGW